MKAIETGADYEAACQRIEALIGCLDGSPEEIELEALIDAVASWQHQDGIELERAIQSTRLQVRLTRR